MIKWTALGLFCAGIISLLVGVIWAYAYYETCVLSSLVLNETFMTFCDVLAGGYLTLVALVVPIGVNMTDKVMDNYNNADIRERYVMPRVRELFAELFCWVIFLIALKIISIYLNYLFYFIIAVFAVLRGVYLSINFSEHLVTVVEDTEKAIIEDYKKQTSNASNKL